MNSITLIIALLVLIVILLLLILLISNLNKKNKIVKEKQNEAEDINVSMPKTFNLFFPSKIESISNRELHDIARKIFDPFKYIDYKNMSLIELDKKEWHSWQISILLLIYKRGEEFFIANQEEQFHSLLLNSSENDMKSLMTMIIKKYNNYIDLNKSKDELCKDYIWSNKDASIIFYFLANYKNYNK